MAWPHAFSLQPGQLGQQPAGPPPRPTIVLVHDAFHTPQHFTQMASLLRSSGWRVQAPRLPSSGANCKGDPMEVDIRSIFDEVREEINMNRNVILVLHGYAGIPGSIAARRLNDHAIGRPRTGFVNQLVFLAGAVAQQTESFQDIYDADWLNYNGGRLGVHNPYQVFFGDCTPEIARQAITILQPQIASSFEAQSPGRPGWMHIPCVYVVCERDNAFPLQCQQDCVRKIQAANARVVVRTLLTSHSPFLSSPQETARVILGSIASIS